jgi:hypothetical protein
LVLAFSGWVLSVGFIYPLGKNSKREVMEKGSEINFDVGKDFPMDCNNPMDAIFGIYALASPIRWARNG